MLLQNYNDVPSIGEKFERFIQDTRFPCVMAKAAIAKEQLLAFTAGHMACPAHDDAILQFLYGCVDKYQSGHNGYTSAVVFFTEPTQLAEALFETLFWQRLQALSDLDAKKYPYDSRVSADPSSPDFSFSLKGEAFYVIGLHPASSRKARQFVYPALVFNPHGQFESLKAMHKYENIKKVTRKRDTLFSGSVNPMLEDFGKRSEVSQYTGKLYNEEWKCPLHIKHLAQ